MQRNFDPARRKFLEAAGRAGLVMAGGLLVPASLGFSRRANAQAQTASQEADHTIRIAPVSHEIAPGKVIKTTAYNGSVPGPTLRLQEGKPVRIKCHQRVRLSQPDPLARALSALGAGRRDGRGIAHHPALLQSWGLAEKALWQGPDQAATPNRLATKVARARMSLLPMFRTCPFLIIAIPS